MTPFGTHRNDPVLTGIADHDDHGGSASAGCTAVAYRSASTASLAAEVQPVRRRVRVRPRRTLPHGDDDLAIGVPFAEIAQRLGHLAERKAAVDDRGDLSGLDELNEGVQVLDAEPDSQQPDALALGSSDQRPDRQ